MRGSRRRAKGQPAYVSRPKIKYGTNVHRPLQHLEQNVIRYGKHRCLGGVKANVCHGHKLGGVRAVMASLTATKDPGTPIIKLGTIYVQQ